MITGSFEALRITNGETVSDTVLVYDFDPQYAAMFIGWTFNLRNVTPVEPPREFAAGEWTGQDSALTTVTVLLWPEPVYDPQALAERLAAEQGGTA